MPAKKDKEKEKGKAASVLKMFADPSVPTPRKQQMLAVLSQDQSDEAKAVVEALFEALTASQADELCVEKAKQLSEMLEMMEQGPLRYATFLELIHPNGANGDGANGSNGHPRGHVVVEDGTEAYTPVPDIELAKSLRRGDGVLLDGQGRALLYRLPLVDSTGESALLERRIGAKRIEVKLRGDEKCVFHASQDLIDKLEKGEIVLGSQVLVNSRQKVAFDAIPSADGLSHYQFLSREKLPNVIVERHIACPPVYIAELEEHIRTELTNPEIRRRYDLPRCAMRLLCGVSGGGKTLSILGFWRRMYEVISEITGVPIDQLPPRVVRLELSKILSPWLGVSDQNLRRAFDEVEQLADEVFAAPDGRTFKLPVLVLIEEADGLGMERTRDHDGVFARILTTALQRLDPARQELRERLIIYIASTNLEQQLDLAFFRRVGGKVVRFGRLNRKAFAAVLSKHLRRRQIASDNGYTEEQLQKKIVSDLTAWLFSPNGADKGVIELMFAGATVPEIRYKRDLLTGALVDEAVRQATEEACKVESSGGRAGLTTEMLMAAFDDQFRAIVNQVNAYNVQSYIGLPDGARIANVRRIPQPAVNPMELQRNLVNQETN